MSRTGTLAGHGGAQAACAPAPGTPEHGRPPPAAVRAEGAGADGTRAARTYRPVLDLLRVAAICAVVVIHVVGQLAATDGLRNPGWYGAAAANALSSWAVPVFVMLSGALTLQPATFRRGTRDFLLRRAGRILPALVAWTAIYELMNWREDGGFSGRQLIVRLLDGTTYSHLYFLWLIAGLYLLAPALRALLAGGRERRAWALGALAAAWSTLVVAAVPQWRSDLDGGAHPVELGAFTMFLPWIGYFVLGRAVVLTRWPRSVGVLLLLGFALLQVWTVADYLTLPEPRGDYWASPPRSFRPVEVAAAVALFAGVWTLARSWRVGERSERVLRTLGRTTFGVFLVHFLVLAPLTAVVPGADTDPQRFPALLLVAAATIVLSFALALVLERIPLLRRIV